MIIGSIGGLHYIGDPTKKALRNPGIPALEIDEKKVGLDIKWKFPDFGTNSGVSMGYKARFPLRQGMMAQFSMFDNRGPFAEQMRKMKEEMDPDVEALFKEMLYARSAIYPQAQQQASQREG